MSLEVGLYHYVALASIIFFLGFLIALVKQNILVVLMGVELMFNAANIVLVAASSFRSDLDGQVMAFFNVAVMAAEVGVGLSLIILFYKIYGDVVFDMFKKIRG